MNGYDWLRWVVLAPIAIALHELILAAYPPVGGFLGGYFLPWTYKLAFLGFASLAAIIAVLAATVIAPSHKKLVGIIAAALTIGYALARLLYFRNPIWPAWYCAVYIACVVIGAALGYACASALALELAEASDATRRQS